jgi:MbtH protein
MGGTPVSEWEQQAEERPHVVVVNLYGQYSVWPHGKDVPDGWRTVGGSRTKQECLAYISEVWTDITPAYVTDASPNGTTN